MTASPAVAELKGASRFPQLTGNKPDPDTLVATQPRHPTCVTGYLPDSRPRDTPPGDLWLSEVISTI
jgi:hypothetical protein